MTKNPFANALAATIYIVIVASIMFYGAAYHFGRNNSVIIPITFISLFTLSAAVMGYLFLYQPIQLYLDGKKKVAVNLFLQTVAFFAVVTFLILLVFFSRI
ncbi:hypothetical protein HY214_02360 [Candidatus Roizmanbacteria bacterium]|nr:hypothetical protein [Candidatus Roizmanbacteria bacterium]